MWWLGEQKITDTYRHCYLPDKSEHTVQFLQVAGFVLKSMYSL